MRSSTADAEGQRDDTRPRNPVDQHVRVDHIAVCICTYRRRAELTKLLSEIEKQQTRGGFTFSVVVVDNDATRRCFNFGVFVDAKKPEASNAHAIDSAFVSEFGMKPGWQVSPGTPCPVGG